MRLKIAALSIVLVSLAMLTGMILGLDTQVQKLNEARTDYAAGLSELAQRSKAHKTLIRHFTQCEKFSPSGYTNLPNCLNQTKVLGDTLCISETDGVIHDLYQFVSEEQFSVLRS